MPSWKLFSFVWFCFLFSLLQIYKIYILPCKHGEKLMLCVTLWPHIEHSLLFEFALNINEYVWHSISFCLLLVNSRFSLSFLGWEVEIKQPAFWLLRGFGGWVEIQTQLRACFVWSVDSLFYTSARNQSRREVKPNLEMETRGVCQVPGMEQPGHCTLG